MQRTLLAAVALLAPGVLLAACAGASSPRPSETVAAPVTQVTREATPSPAPATALPAACAGRTLEAIPGHVPGEVSLDADGDGVPDRAYTLPFPDHALEGLPVSVHLILDDRGGVGVVLPVKNVTVAPIGGYDVNGDGRDELFVKTGEGAYTTWIDVFEFDPVACALVRLAAPGAVLPQFAVGSSAGGGAGLACRDHALVSTDTGRISEEPLRYRARITTYEIAGTALRITGTSDADVDDASAARAATFLCGDLRLPAGR